MFFKMKLQPILPWQCLWNWGPFCVGSFYVFFYCFLIPSSLLHLGHLVLSGFKETSYKPPFRAWEWWSPAVLRSSPPHTVWTPYSQENSLAARRDIWASPSSEWSLVSSVAQNPSLGVSYPGLSFLDITPVTRLDSLLRVPILAWE